MLPSSYSYPVDSILLLGPTGVGKSPLGDMMAVKGLFGRRCHHFDFGAELRQAVTGTPNSSAFYHDEIAFIHGVLEHGLLLENEHFPLAQKILSLFLDRVVFAQRDILVLNGIPRHSGQANDIATVAHIHAVIVLDCTADDVFFRIDKNVGGDRSTRIDDNRELIEKKLAIFRERTAPLIEHYAQTGSVVYPIPVSGTMTAEQTYDHVFLFSRTHPPVALVAEPPQG